MEESEKRKERLKAMRSAAAEAESLNNNGTLPVPTCLSNPLNESSAPLSVQQESGAAPRFDFYTNRMAAFLRSKRNNAANPNQQNYPTLNHGPQSNRQSPTPSGLRNLDSRPSPAHQWQPSLNQRPHQPHNSQQNSHAYPIKEGFYPQGWNRPDGPPSFYHPPNFPRNPGFPTPNPRHSGNPNFTPRQSHWRSHSNFQGQGRGQSFGRNLGGSGRFSGGRGFGFHSRGSERLYDKSMVEDPWKDLSPVLWTQSESPLTNSGAKKPKVQNFVNNPRDGSNLAEF